MKVGLMKQVDGYCVFIRVFSYGMMVVFMKTQVILIKGHKDRPVKTTIWEVQYETGNYLNPQSLN